MDGPGWQKENISDSEDVAHGGVFGVCRGAVTAAGGDDTPSQAIKRVVFSVRHLYELIGGLVEVLESLLCTQLKKRRSVLTIFGARKSERRGCEPRTKNRGCLPPTTP